VWGVHFVESVVAGGVVEVVNVRWRLDWVACKDFHRKVHYWEIALVDLVVVEVDIVVVVEDADYALEGKEILLAIVDLGSNWDNYSLSELIVLCVLAVIKQSRIQKLLRSPNFTKQDEKTTRDCH
jgi:hypothetical protein